MSYEPTVWKTGDVVTSAKLNKLEQGVASGGLVVTGIDPVYQSGTLNKTWQEIFDAVSSGRFVVAADTFEYEGKTYSYAYPLEGLSYSPDGYIVKFDNTAFKCESADDFPNKS